MRSCQGVLLVIHDTTEIDFSGLKSVKDLGPIGHGGCGGYLCHNSLAYDYDAREVLGLAGQTIHVRRKVPKAESPKAKRDHPQRESRLWKKGWLSLPPAIAGQMRVNIADRGADMFEFIEAVEAGRDHYVIRSKSDRNIEIDDGSGGTIKTKLHAYAQGLCPMGERTVEVSNNKGNKARSATVTISASKVSIQAPHFARGEHSPEPLTAWVARVVEANPPPGQMAVEWILLSNVPADDFAAAAERADWYACRPVVEECHKALKTGCGVELMQFTTGAALRAGIAMVSVVATQLLRLRDLSRREDAAVRPATEVVDREYVATLCAWRFGALRPGMSVGDFCMALAKLGGHLNRRHDRPPGWLVLWRGWSKLQQMVDGARLGAITRCV